MAGRRGNLRNAPPHRAGADDADLQATLRHHCPVKFGERFSMNARTPSV